MIRASIGIFLLAAALPAQSKSPTSTVAFADGTTIAFTTRSTGAAAGLSSSTAIDDVPAGYDFHRLVFSKENVVFGYDLEARKDGKGSFALRAKPVNREQVAVGGFGKWADIPTLNGVREFPPLRTGDSVEVDILYTAATKERLYDVVTVLPEQPARAPRQQVAGDRFSFKSVSITADGKGLGGSQSAWMRCGGMKMHLPLRGTFYLSPYVQPEPFKPAAWVDRKTLRLLAGSELVEIVSQTNMLQKSEFGTVWVWHVPDQPGDRSEELGFHCADSIDQVLPRK
jgi:hypothetical protein